ncbi:MAG: orotate phosphoribosyltransferase [Pseudomonadota bacterium]
MNTPFQHQFLEYVISENILQFGEFITKSGRKSPYFFNAGLFNHGESLMKLGQFYAQALMHGGIAFDMLFGPAYKGIPLASSLAIALAQEGRSVPFAFNRKEVKDHGEGGVLIGAPLQGRVLIVDDVVTAGMSVRESVALIKQAGALPAGVLIALDRMERGQNALSATQEIQNTYGIPVIAVANLDDLWNYLSSNAQWVRYRDTVEDYRAEYGVTSAN